MLGIERTQFALHCEVGDTERGSVLIIGVKWWEYASDVGSDEEYEVEWRLNFYTLSMRGGRRPVAELREFVLDAVRRHFEPPEGRWSELNIVAGEDGEVNEYDITITYRARTHPSRLERVRGLVDGIAATLGVILESHGVLPQTA